MVQSFQPFIRPSDAAILRSPIPRGLLTFASDEIASAAKPVNDQYFLRFSVSLPQNYAHVLADLSAFLAVDTASDFEAAWVLETQDNYPLAAENKTRYAIPTLTGAVVNGDPIILMNEPQSRLPRAPIWTVSGTQPTLVLSITNNAAAVMAAGTTAGLMSFWQYDLEQVRSYPVNAPFLVANR